MAPREIAIVGDCYTPVIEKQTIVCYSLLVWLRYGRVSINDKCIKCNDTAASNFMISLVTITFVL